MSTFKIMGIQHLNTYIRRNTDKTAINKIQLSDLHGKIITVDISIYLYKYTADEALLENIYSMLSVFRANNIIPIFIFDGIAPAEKSTLLMKRCNDKILAEQQYNILYAEYMNEKCDERRNEMADELTSLKKKFIKIRRYNIYKVKELIDAFGMKWIDAEGEADELCANLVINGNAYACLSEDMDMFIYGCTRVLRYLSLMNETVVIYYYDEILSQLNILPRDFKQICVISGTDYNIEYNCKINLYETLKHYKNYKQSDDNDFYNWLLINTSYVQNCKLFHTAYEVFNLENKHLFNFKLPRTNRIINKPKIHEIMIPEGFIFPIDRCKYTKYNRMVN